MTSIPLNARGHPSFLTAKHLCIHLLLPALLVSPSGPYPFWLTISQSLPHSRTFSSKRKKKWLLE